MENEIQSNVPPVQPLPSSLPSISNQSSTNWSKILLFTVLGLVIIVGSVFVGIQIGKNQTPKKQPITAQPSASLTPSPNVEWKKYSNSSYQYSVEYPSMWKTSTGDNGLTTNFTQVSSPDFISITVHDNPNSTEIHQWLIDKSIVPNPNDISTHIQEEDVIVSGSTSVKINTPANGGQFSIYIPKGNRIYSIYNNVDQNSQSSQESYDQNLIIMNQMVSTFKFTN